MPAHVAATRTENLSEQSDEAQDQRVYTCSGGSFVVSYGGAIEAKAARVDVELTDVNGQSSNNLAFTYRLQKPKPYVARKTSTSRFVLVASNQLGYADEGRR